MTVILRHKLADAFRPSRMSSGRRAALAETAARTRNLPASGSISSQDHTAFWSAVARYELRGNPDDAAMLARVCKGAAWNSCDAVPLGEYYRLSKIIGEPFASGSYAKAARAVYRKLMGGGLVGGRPRKVGGASD